MSKGGKEKPEAYKCCQSSSSLSVYESEPPRNFSKSDSWAVFHTFQIRIFGNMVQLFAFLICLPGDADVAIIVCQFMVLRWTFKGQQPTDMKNVLEPPTFILKPATPCPISSYYAFSLIGVPEVTDR